MARGLAGLPACAQALTWTPYYNNLTDIAELPYQSGPLYWHKRSFLEGIDNLGSGREFGAANLHISCLVQL